MQFIGIARAYFKEIKYPELINIPTLEATKRGENKAFFRRVAVMCGTWSKPLLASSVRRC